jgi:hypothetical protein
MSQRDGDWGAEDDEVVRRLRDGKPRMSAFELDGIKTRVMARVRPSTSRRTSSRFGLLVAMLTFGAMVAGTAGTIAAGNSPFTSGTGAAQSQYRPPKCNPNHEDCSCPGGSDRSSRDRCVCPSGLTFAAGTNDCRCPNGSSSVDGKCVTCPDGGTFTDSGHCVCPDHGTEIDGKCVRTHHPPDATQPTASTVPKATSGTSSGQTALTPASTTSAPTTVGTTTHSRKDHATHGSKRS